MALRNIGELRHRITFQRRPDPEATNDKGFPLTAWTDAAKAWAYREDVSGKEFFGAAAVNMEETTIFTIHYRDDIDTSMRIAYKGRLFEIIHIGGGRNVGDFLMIRAKRIVKEGGIG